MNEDSLIALVTGAAGGIGSAIAKRILPLVDHVILVDVHDENLHALYTSLKKQTEKKINKYCCDVGETNAVNEILSIIDEKYGSPGILINCAGIGGPFHRVDEVTDEEWYRVINTNLKSVFNFSRILLPKMQAAKFGKIINIASVQGFLGAALSSTYVASKHAVVGYTRAIAAEWGQFGITCNAICPGYVNTKMGLQENKIDQHTMQVIKKTPLGRIATPKEIAGLVAYLIGDESSFINGSILTIDGGLTCHVGVS